jgi:hypothetical protein
MVADERRCARHPERTTNLSCSRCGKPVCTRCMVYTPVGVRCPECARDRQAGPNAPTRADVGKALLAAVTLAVAFGVAWGSFPRYGFWLALLLGFGGGELVSLAANRRRGPKLQAAAGLMVGGAFAVAWYMGAPLTHGALVTTLLGGLAMGLAVARQR